MKWDEEMWRGKGLTPLEGFMFEGACPLCGAGEMLLNIRKWFECPQCHLLINVLSISYDDYDGKEVYVENYGGEGKFQTKEGGGHISAKDLLSVPLKITHDGRGEGML